MLAKIEKLDTVSHSSVFSPGLKKPGIEPLTFKLADDRSTAPQKQKNQKPIFLTRVTCREPNKEQQ